MYTFIITAIITAIAISCIIRNKEKTNSVFSYSFLSFTLVTLLTCTIVTIIHKDNLQLLHNQKTYIAIPQNVGNYISFIKRDTTYIENKYVVNVQLYDTLPIGIKADTVFHKQQTGVSLLINNKDTLLAIYMNDEDVMQFGPCEYTISDTTKIEEHKIFYEGDKWVIGWSIPDVNNYHKIFISQKDVNYLNSQNSKIFSKWKKV